MYFGLDASGFENARECLTRIRRSSADDLDDLHPFLGPILIIIYALLSNTLLLTVLVAILGNTFATINADAAAEVSLKYDNINSPVHVPQSRFDARGGQIW